MRDYGTVSPRFWIGETGKQLRGNLEAQVLALYLMTSPHANMIGVFHCPILYMGHETGLGLEGASKGLASLIEAGFCTYEEASETVFVHRMAAFQIADRIKPSDKRAGWVIKEWQNISSDKIKAEFFAIYSEAYNLPKEEENTSPIEAPSKPLPSQEQEQEQEQEQKKSARKRASPALEKPDDVSGQVWADWLKLRKDKRAAVTETVMAEARREAGRARISLERFLAIWCIRGSQGLQASWLSREEIEGDGNARSEKSPQWALDAGFPTVWEAENALCFERNAHEFRDGKRIGVAA